MNKDKVFFDFGLPLAVELGRPDETPSLILREHITVILVIEGDILFNSIRCRDIYREGDIFILESNSPLEISSTTGKPAAILLLSFDMSYFSLKHPYICAAAFRQDSGTTDKTLLEKILNIAISVLDFESEKYAVLKTESSALLTELVRSHQFYSGRLIQEADDKNQLWEYNSFMESLMNYIGCSYDSMSTLNSFAAECHLSPNYLSHRIKKISGKTFQEILSFIRCIKSQEFLLADNCKISRLALDMGFSSSKYYIENFNKYFGLTPLQYRETLIGKRHKKLEYDRNPETILSLLKIFTDINDISIYPLKDTMFTHNTCDITTNLGSYVNVLSDMGRVSSIRSPLTETAHEVFDELHKNFRISVITIDVETSLKGIEPGALFTVSRNINSLLNLGFTVALETKNLSAQTVKLIADFFEFHSKLYRDNISIIKVLIRMNLPESQLEHIKKAVSSDLLKMVGFNIEVITAGTYMNDINYINEIYDSLLLTPFAMDELFNPQNWNREIAFSLIDEINIQGMFLKGGNGLLAWNGIKKPWWYAYIMVSKLYGTITDKGDDHIITNDNDRIAILTFNKCGQEGNMLSTIKNASQLDEAIEAGKNMRREHSFHLTNIYGKIKATHYSLNKDACLYSKWATLNFKESVTGEEENIMSTVCHPDISFQILEADGELDITTVEDTFGVSLVVLEKI